jgi:hypothetical protein
VGINTGQQPLNYYICNGTDPTKDFKTPITVYGVVEIGTIIFNILVLIRIRIFKHFSQSQTLPDGQGRKLKNAFLAEMKQQSLVSFSLTFCNMLSLASTKISLRLLNKVEPDKLQTNGVIILTHYGIVPGALAFLYLISFYAKHAPLRKAVFSKAQSLLMFNK